MKGGELLALAPLALVTLGLLTPPPALAGFSAETTASATFRAAESFVTQSTAPPVVAGDVRVGGTLTASLGAWSPTPASFARQWMRCAADCADVPGQTGASYLLSPGDIGYAIRHRVSAGGAAATSAPTAALGPVPASTAPLAGLAWTSAVLEAPAAAWTLNPHLPVQTRTTWWRCVSATDTSCAHVATGPAYALTASDAGRWIRSRAHAAQNGVESVQPLSGPLGPIATLPPRLSATAFVSVPGPPPTAITDDDPATTWNSNRRAQPGDFVVVDLGEERSLVAYEAVYATPGSFQVSESGVGWTTIPTDPMAYTPGPGTVLPAGTRARFLRLRASASSTAPWSVSEIRLWGS